MDVKKIVNERKLNEYLHWLEVALRAEVICNSAFSHRFEEIKRFISTGGYGQLSLRGASSAFGRKFERLVYMVRAVADKYMIPGFNPFRDRLISNRKLK